MTTAATSDSRPRRRKYSKTGCTECKRRKIKCDESKPVCLHCRRMHKPCIYLPPKPRKTRRGQRPGEDADESPDRSSFQVIAPAGSLVPGYAEALSMADLQSTPSSSAPRQLPPLLPFLAPPPHQYYPQPPISAPAGQAQQPQPQTPVAWGPPGPPGQLPFGQEPQPIPQIASFTSHLASPFPPQPPQVQPPQVQPVPQVTAQPTPQPAPPPAFSPSGPTPGAKMSLASVSIPDFDTTTSANSLAQSLNDILATKIDEAKGSGESEDFEDVESPLLQMLEEGQYYKGDAPQEDFILAGHVISAAPTPAESATESPQQQTASYVPSFVTNPPQPASFQFSGDHKKYLDYFCNDFARVISPFTPSPQSNPARDIVLAYARNHNYLLTAVLACGALQVHRQTRDPQHEANYRSYLSTCARLLASLFADQNKIKEQIEPMILTILLLTSYTAMSNVQKWRPHLKAAKELLAANPTQKGKPSESEFVIAFCRAWYTSIEVLAGLTAPQGGTTDNDNEIDSIIFNIPNLKPYLELMHISRADDFNILYGYTNTLAMTLQRLTKLIRRCRKTMPATNPDISLSDANEIFSQLWSQTEYSIISRDGIVPRTHWMHPDNRGKMRPPPGFEPLSSEAVEMIELEDGQQVCVSWYDISQQSFIMAACLIMLSLVVQLRKRHYMVQEAVHRSLNLMIFLRAKKPVTGYVLMLLQCSMYITGLNCIDDADRKLVLKFFGQLTVMGNISASVNAEKLKRKWKRYDENRRNIPIEPEFDDFDEEELPDDIISY